MRLKYLLILSITALLSCSDEKCTVQTTVYATMKAYTKSGDTETAKTIPKLLLHELQTNSYLDTIINQENITFWLNQESDTSTFKFTIEDKSDTLDIISSRSTHFISYECGFVTYFEIDTIVQRTKNLIDSISIAKKTLTLSNEENIKIYIN